MVSRSFQLKKNLQVERWYYNATEGTCREFVYTACGGNRNSFRTEEECLETCHPGREEGPFSQLKAMSLTRDAYLGARQNIIMNDAVANDHPVIDCRVKHFQPLHYPCDSSEPVSQRRFRSFMSIV